MKLKLNGEPDKRSGYRPDIGIRMKKQKEKTMSIPELKKIGNNETEVTTGHGFIIFFSYETPVAARHIESGKEYRSDKRFSVTTSKHLNKWCSPNAVLVSQEKLENILTKGSL